MAARPPRVISSPVTPLMKFGVPPLLLWEVAAGVLGVVRVSRSGVVVTPSAIALMASVLVLTLWVTWFWIGLKRVAVTETDLHISNYRREIAVPLRDVDRVAQRRLAVNAVVVYLARDTEFGRRVAFYPKGHYFTLIWTHP